MQYTIQIPKPCNESWEQMTAADKGRHCAQCCKTVVDFTQWEHEDILLYLQQQGDSKICGRFKAKQINVPFSANQFITSVSHSTLPFHKQMAAVLLFAFGMLQMSCDTAEPQKKPVVQTNIAIDTSNQKPEIMGEFPAPEPVKKHTIKKVKQSKPLPPEQPMMGAPIARPEPIPEPKEYLKGDVMLEPADTIKGKR